LNKAGRIQPSRSFEIRNRKGRKSKGERQVGRRLTCRFSRKGRRGHFRKKVAPYGRGLGGTEKGLKNQGWGGKSGVTIGSSRTKVSLQGNAERNYRW